MNEQKWLLSNRRFELKEAEQEAVKLLKFGCRIRFDDLAAGMDEKGEAMITCRISILESSIRSEWFDLFRMID